MAKNTGRVTDDTPAGKLGLDPRDPWYIEINRAAASGVPGAVKKVQASMAAGEPAPGMALQIAPATMGALDTALGGKPNGAARPDNTRNQSSQWWGPDQQTVRKEIERSQDMTQEGRERAEINRYPYMGSGRIPNPAAHARNKAAWEKARLSWRRKNSKGKGGGKLNYEYEDPGRVVPGDGSE